MESIKARWIISGPEISSQESFLIKLSTKSPVKKKGNTARIHKFRAEIPTKKEINKNDVLVIEMDEEINEKVTV